MQTHYNCVQECLDVALHLLLVTKDMSVFCSKQECEFCLSLNVAASVFNGNAEWYGNLS